MCINKLLGKFNQLFHQNHQMSNLRKINNSPWEGPPLMFAALSYPIKTLLWHLPKKSTSKLDKLCLHYILSQFYQHFTSIFSILHHFPSLFARLVSHSLAPWRLFLGCCPVRTTSNCVVIKLMQL